MKKIKFTQISAAVCVLVALTLVISCTSAPAKASQASTVRVSLMSQEGLRHDGGSTFVENPYLIPEGMIKGKPNEFIVLKVDFALTAPALVEVQAKAVNPEGAPVAPLFSIEDMKTFWEAWPAKESDVLRRLDRLERTYMPELITKAPKGSTTWYLVFVGKNPIPRPTKVVVKAFIGEGAPASFEFDLPEVAKK